jgi:hypothetical protein
MHECNLLDILVPLLLLLLLQWRRLWRLIQEC